MQSHSLQQKAKSIGTGDDPKDGFAAISPPRKTMDKANHCSFDARSFKKITENSVVKNGPVRFTMVTSATFPSLEA